MEILTIHPNNKDQLEAIKAVLKALKIPFKKNESPYYPAFVKKVREAENEREGSITLNSTEEIDQYFKGLDINVQD
jgi:hypothetical protein